MSQVDLSSITNLTVQINALQQTAQSVSDPGAKALIQAQITMLSAQLTAQVQHAQAQSDASANLLDGLGLFATLSSVVGTSAPSIIALFKR
jgi:hypothetical protein